MKRHTRRQFLQTTAFGAAGAFFAPKVSINANANSTAANDKLGIAVIGVGNQGGWNLSNIAGQNIVALCDVDDKFLAAAAQKFPRARKYNDFRRMLEQKGIDAVLVATPDHTHAVSAVAALNSGRHVYCEKPLTRTISECRKVREAASQQKLATQMGTQIHAGTNYRRVVELVQSGAIGSVDEVHVWIGTAYGGKERPTDTPPTPPHLHWDLWLGPVEERPYNPVYVPFHWRNWWAFGGGTLADMGCHYIDLPHWALDLREPVSAELLDGPPVDAESPPTWMVVRYEYPARGQKPPVKLTWYHGGRRPELLKVILTEEQRQEWGPGVLFVGKKGMLLANYGRHQLLPENEFVDFVRPEPFIPNSIGHHQEWVAACKTGSPTTCNFDYSGALTEAVLLGNVAYRVQQKLEWDSKQLRATNCPEADRFIQHKYRAGWRI
jgi:predicted dehydrogenase